MHLVIISGRSGSGKSVALRALEDLGYYCIDNMPIGMLYQLDQEIGNTHKIVAISIDSRNISENFSQLESILNEIKNKAQQSCKIVYLDANENVILKRFSETRRKHPLTSNQTSLREAVAKESLLLTPIASLANYTIDTSQIGQHELHALIQERFAHEQSCSLQILIQSFGFKYGLPPDADFIFDVRCLPNPYWEPNLKEHTGQDQEVIDFLSTKTNVVNMIEQITNFLKVVLPNFQKNNRSYLNISIGCTGGRHRSVFIAERLQQHLQEIYQAILVRHREICHL